MVAKYCEEIRCIFISIYKCENLSIVGGENFKWQQQECEIMKGISTENSLNSDHTGLELVLLANTLPLLYSTNVDNDAANDVHNFSYLSHCQSAHILVPHFRITYINKINTHLPWITRSNYCHFQWISYERCFFLTKLLRLRYVVWMFLKKYRHLW